MVLNNKVFDVEGVWCYRLIDCVLNNAVLESWTSNKVLLMNGVSGLVFLVF